MKLHLRSTAFAAVLLLGAHAFAQQPPAPPPPGVTPPPPVQSADGATAATTGRIQQFLVNPNGQVDGLLLVDGTQVTFPPHLSASVLELLKAGDTVKVSGWRAPNVPVVRAASLTAANGKQIVDQPPAQVGALPLPPDRSALTAMTANGRVTRVLYTDRGEANGVLLSSGTAVRFPPMIGSGMAPATPKVGGTLYAKGWGSRSAQGSTLEATSLGPTAQTMTEVAPATGPGPAAGPGPAGPGRDPATLPPPPPAP